jgi:opacity protein-like surface antigen
MKKLAAFLFLAVAGTPAAWAQYGELWFSAGQSLMGNAGLGSLQTIGGNEDDVEFTNGFRFGFRVAFNNDNIFGHEIQYAYSRTQLRFNDTAGSVEQGMAIHTGGYNFLVYATQEGIRVRPFATGGVMFNNYVPPGASAASGGGDTKFGFSYGGGVKIRVTGIWAIRFDLRQYTTPKPFDLPLASGWLRQTEATAGFGIVF